MNPKQTQWWMAYESFPDCVYISDVHTYELVYMNQATRETFHKKASEEYLGKHCYEVLQNRTSVCPFCTNHRLQYGKYHEWHYFNPVLKKRYLNKDTIVDDQGRTLRIEISTCLDSIKYHTPQKEHLFFDYSEIISQCTHIAHSSSNPEEALNRVLKLIGTTFHCECTSIFLYDDDHLLTLTYDWMQQPIFENKTRINLLQTSKIWEHLAQSKSGMIIDDVQQFEVMYPALTQTCYECGIHNYIIEPLCLEDTVIGFWTANNIAQQNITKLAALLSSARFFIVTLLSNHQETKKLQFRVNIDALIGCKNHNAFLEACQEFRNHPEQAIGIIYFDVSTFQNNFDHDEDNLQEDWLKYCYRKLSTTFPYDCIYRIQGQAFVVLMEEHNRVLFDRQIDKAKSLFSQEKYHIAIGGAWKEDANIDIYQLLYRANNEMEEEKEAYLKMVSHMTQQKQEARAKYLSKPTITADDFLQYLQHGQYHMNTIFRALSIENVPNCIFLGDLESNLFYVSDGIRKKFGIEHNIVPDFFYHWSNRIEMPEERQLYDQQTHELIYGQREKVDLHYRVRDKNNHLVWVRSYALVQRDIATGNAAFYTGFLSWSEYEFAIDFVTGFAESIFAIKKLEEIQKTNMAHTVIAFSPNNMREINEARGRHGADRLLRQMAVELSDQLGRYATFFRLDGVRFLALVPYMDDEWTKSMIQQIQTIIEQVYDRFHVRLNHVCSLAVLEYPCDITPHEFLNTVCSALRIAKDGKQNYYEHHKKLLEEQQKKSTLSLDLSKSVMNQFDGFRIVIQPIVHAQTGEICKGEVLLRWSKGNQSVSPAVFIPILEQTDLILSVGKWVFEQTVATCKEFLSYRPDFHLSFNVSYYQILDDTFPDFMETILKKYDIDGSHFTMELTESHFDDAPERLHQFIQRCRDSHIQVALDDFGSGYSSLGLLLKYSIDVIKLDKSILNNMTVSEQHVKFVRSIIYACHEFGKKVVTEGVETEQEAALIRQAGSDMIQGYYYYKPLEIDALHHILLQHI